MRSIELLSCEFFVSTQNRKLFFIFEIIEIEIYESEFFMDKIALLNSIEKNIRFSFSRSGGAGGQNVNKLNTKVHATLDFASLEGLSQTEVALAKNRLAGRMNSEGEIFVDAQEERFQERNRSIALDKMKSIVVQAALVPKKRKKTKPSASSIERRLNSKKLRGKIKELRRKF